MREKHVLSSAIKQRAAFAAVAAHVEREDFTEQGWIVWEGICRYYDADAGCASVDTGILADSIARTVSADKHKEMFRQIIGNLRDMDASPANVVDDLLATKREVKANELANALLTKDERTDIILGEYTALVDAKELDDEPEEDARIGLSVKELVAQGFEADNLITLAPPSLNERLDGGLKPGHHIILFARPEMGKTMLTIEMMAGFAAQDLRTLYCGNEDPLDDINMRIVNRLSGMTKLEVINAPNRADELARKAGYENIVMKALAPGTAREITSLLEKYKPHVLVLDQLRNLNMKNDNYVLALEAAAKQARQWAKRYSCVVVSVTQAGDSADGKAVLDMGDVDFSNTGIPSQADLMVGMGANKNHKEAGEVVLSLPKNKISGRHEYFSCQTNPQLSQVISIG